MARKTCSCCRKTVPREKFVLLHPKIGNPRLDSWCKECRTRDANRWYAENREKKLASIRERYASDTEFRNDRKKRTHERYVGNIDYQRQCKEVAKKHRRKAGLKHKYGLSIPEFQAMQIRQRDRCAICLLVVPEGKRLQVDHDHATGRIRELLCGKCNSMLGFCGDSVSVLWSAIQYVQQHREVEQVG